MGRQKKTGKSFWQHEGFSFGMTVVSVSVVFIFLGYIMGQYAVEMVGQRHGLTTVNEQQSEMLSQEIERQLGQLTDATLDDDSVVVNQSTAITPTRQQLDQQPNQLPQRTAQQPQVNMLYRVQLGAFSQKENAQRLVKDLQARGYEAIVSGGPPFRVQTGAFAQEDNAQRYAVELQEKGYEVTIIRQ